MVRRAACGVYTPNVEASAKAYMRGTVHATPKAGRVPPLTPTRRVLITSPPPFFFSFFYFFHFVLFVFLLFSSRTTADVQRYV